MIQCAIALSLLLQGATTEMSVTLEGEIVGTAFVTSKISADGNKKAQSKLVLANGVTVVDEAEYAKDGTPLRKYLRMTGGGAPQEMRVVTFAKGIAHVIAEKDGLRTTSDVPAPAGASIRAVSEMWFFGAKPAVGQTCTYQRFDMNKLAWVEMNVRYEGPGDLMVGKTAVKSHLISMDGLAKSWLSDDGKPLRIEMGKLTFVRTKA